MRRVWIVTAKDIHEALVSKTTYTYFIILFFISAPYFSTARSSINVLLNHGTSPVDLQNASQLLIDGIFNSYPLILIMLVCGVFSAYAVIMDKTKRSIESLLASPLSLRQVWAGKALAVTLPALVIGLVVTILMGIALNIIVFRPATHGIFIPGYRSLICSFILIPVLTYLTVAIVTFMQLMMTNPRLASLIFSLIFIGVYITTITQVSTHFDFVTIYLGIIGLLFIITVIVSRLLTKEKIVLSSKA